MGVRESGVVFAEVTRVAERIRNGDRAVVPVLGCGDVVRQGDIYLIRIDDDGDPAPEVVADGPWSSRQLAPGTSRGARHEVEGDCELAVPDPDWAATVLAHLIPATSGVRQFWGPLIRARGPVAIVHPDHGDRVLPGPALYLVTYQRTWADEVRRQVD